jgi:hypothetical protein
MGPRLFTVVAVVILRVAMHAVIHGIRIGEAVGGVAAMPEGQDRGRRYKAERGEDGNGHRHAEAKPGAESPHYALSVVGRRRCDKPHR